MSQTSEAQGARLVVMGASDGGAAVLPALLAQLPPSLEAIVLVVQHLRTGTGQPFIERVRRRCALPVEWAEDGHELTPRRIYFAPPDLHLVVDGKRTLLVDGPRENHARPSINRLFRAAAAHHDGRVVGVLLSGSLDDGCAGAAAIRRGGGVVLVQEPGDAPYPELPTHAIESVSPDAVLPLAQLGEGILRFVERPHVAHPIPDDLTLEAELDRVGMLDIESMQRLGPLAPVTCSSCDGPMWQSGGPGGLQYRCIVGHAEGSHTLIEDKSDQVEQLLWSVIRTLEEKSSILLRLAAEASRNGQREASLDYERQGQDARSEAAASRAFLLRLRKARRARMVNPAAEEKTASS